MPAAATLLLGCTAQSVSRKARLSSACTTLHRHGAKPYGIARGRGCTSFRTTVSLSAALTEIWVQRQVGNAANTDNNEGKLMGL